MTQDPNDNLKQPLDGDHNFQAAVVADANGEDDVGGDTDLGEGDVSQRSQRVGLNQNDDGMRPVDMADELKDKEEAHIRGDD